MNSAEKIVFIPETTTFGGGERVLLALSRHLHDRAIPHRFTWYYRTVALASHASWPVREEHLEPPRRPWRKVRALGSCLRRAGDGGAVLLVGIQAALHAGLCAARGYSLLILDTPSLLSGAAPSIAAGWRWRVREQGARLLIRRAMRRARSVMVTTAYMAEEVRRLYGVEANVVRQGAPEGQFRPRRAPAGGPLRLLSVCRLEANKRVDWMLRSLVELGREDPGGARHRFVLDVVGAGGEEAGLRRLAAQLGVTEAVTFHGRVDEVRLEALYERAHLFLMPARQGYGLPALEALSRGLPVVVHRESGVSEILGDTPWVELIAGSAGSLAASVRRLAARVESGELLGRPRPVFPTESEWADAVCRRCGWVA